MERPIPLAYLVTFACYGARLHGDDAGSVDRHQNLPGSGFLPPNPAWAFSEQKLLKQRPYELDRKRRSLVLKTVREVSAHRDWTLLAAHARSTHVHVVVAASATPEQVMNTMKSYASRALNLSGLDGAGCRRWVHHGSTRYLWKPENVASAIHYVVRGQGKPMAVWENPECPSW